MTDDIEAVLMLAALMHLRAPERPAKPFALMAVDAWAEAQNALRTMGPEQIDQMLAGQTARRPRALPRTHPPGDPVVEAFQQFYEAYPRHIAKQAALRAWRQVKPPQADVMAGVARYKTWLERDGTPPQFIKHPSTWLNGRCWEDEYGEPQPDNRRALNRAAERNDMFSQAARAAKERR